MPRPKPAPETDHTGLETDHTLATYLCQRVKNFCCIVWFSFIDHLIACIIMLPYANFDTSLDYIFVTCCLLPMFRRAVKVA